jgi:hypothetical protein
MSPQHYSCGGTRRKAKVSELMRVMLQLHKWPITYGNSKLLLNVLMPTSNLYNLLVSK